MFLTWILVALYQILSNSEARQLLFLQVFLSDVFWLVNAGLYPMDFNGLKTVCVCGQLKSPRNTRFSIGYWLGRNLKYLISVSGCFDLVMAW